jgi:hypothetical protein
MNLGNWKQVQKLNSLTHPIPLGVGTGGTDRDSRDGPTDVNVANLYVWHLPRLGVHLYVHKNYREARQGSVGSSKSHKDPISI